MHMGLHLSRAACIATGRAICAVAVCGWFFWGSSQVAEGGDAVRAFTAVVEAMLHYMHIHFTVCAWQPPCACCCSRVLQLVFTGTTRS